MAITAHTRARPTPPVALEDGHAVDLFKTLKQVLYPLVIVPRGIDLAQGVDLDLDGPFGPDPCAQPESLLLDEGSTAPTNKAAG
jgi:hypothetical protein